MLRQERLFQMKSLQSPVMKDSSSLWCTPYYSGTPFYLLTNEISYWLKLGVCVTIGLMIESLSLFVICIALVDHLHQKLKKYYSVFVNEAKTTILSCALTICALATKKYVHKIQKQKIKE